MSVIDPPRIRNGAAADVEGSDEVNVEGSDEVIVSKIVVEKLERSVIDVPIVGVTPLIPHKWSEKAKRRMREKQQGHAVAKLSPKDAAKEAADATYWLADGRLGMPSTAFKAAIADASRYFGKTVTAEDLKRIIYVHGEIGQDGDVLVPIEGPFEAFEAPARNSGGTADLRYRNRVFPWSATLRIDFFPTMISAEALVNIVDAAGIGGVGDWRPSSPKSKAGVYGKFEIAT